ncbi:alpha/beta hydrolase family protein [Nocardia amikacinitolerans]|uniref:alpha/beta hydrolase family protein n=1 Tax=Nocardia amikacinitolerans TaxID=756689 RepID=UPI002646C1C6|nr:hypothetical protein [Nocardia amikacinitolerans]
MVAVSAVGVAEASPEAPPGDAVILSVPAPTGPYAVGVTELQLTDPDRADPWDAGRRRELLVQIWYPADGSRAAPAAPWMPLGGQEAQRSYLTELGVPEGSWSLGPSHSHRDEPAGVGRFPVLLNSPGMGDTTGWSTAQAEDLASHGYIVVAMNHTHEAFAVHFPDGRVQRTVVPLDSPQEVLRDLLLPTRVADTEFVLDELTANAAGHPLPEHLVESMDLSRVGMFGHSLGGSTTTQALHDDPRIRAGVNLDGPVLGSVADDGTDRPLLMLASESSPWFGKPGWEPYWRRNTGLKLPLRLPGTQHMSFCDQQAILSQLATAGLLSTDTKTKAVGSIDADRSIELQRTYLRVYFDVVFGRLDADVPDALERFAQPATVPYQQPE